MGDASGVCRVPGTSPIRNGESSGVEFKQDDIQPEDLAEELVAFLNFERGVVLLGVEDAGTVSGIVRRPLARIIHPGSK